MPDIDHDIGSGPCRPRHRAAPSQSHGAGPAPGAASMPPGRLQASNAGEVSKARWRESEHGLGPSPVHAVIHDAGTPQMRPYTPFGQRKHADVPQHRQSAPSGHLSKLATACSNNPPSVLASIPTPISAPIPALAYFAMPAPIPPTGRRPDAPGQGRSSAPRPLKPGARQR